MKNAINRALAAKKNYIKNICAILLMVVTSANAWATTETLNFNKCDWGLSKDGTFQFGFYSADGYSVYGEDVRQQYYSGDYNGIILNKNTSAFIILPSIPATVTRIDVVAYSGASVDANISLYVNDVLISEQHIGRGSVYWTGSWASGAIIKLQNDDNAKGNITQIASVTITHNGSKIGGSAPVGEYQINTLAYPAGAGTVSASPSSATAGTSITLSATPASGYQFKEWDVTYTTACNEPTYVAYWEWTGTNTFNMPGGKVTAVAIFEESTCTTPTVTFTNAGPYAKTVGASGFTNTATARDGGSGTGQTITYSTSNSSVANVNSSTGAVTIGSTAGTAIITATAAENATYCEASASYTINVAAVAPTLSHNTSGKELTTSSITSSGLSVSGGIITDKGGASITKYGFVIGTGCDVTYATATKKGGWNSDKALNSAFSSAEFSDLSANTTYYVRAFAYNGTEYGYSDCVSFTTLASYVITHDKNDGSGTTTTTNVDAGGSITVGSGTSFTRTGYTLTNWRLNNASTGTEYSTGASYSSISANATFYAQWTANTYSVRFNRNGGTGGANMANQNFIYGVAQNLTTNTYTRAGYNFAGWATSENGAVVHADGANVNNLTSTNGAVVDLYAKWTAHEISLTLDKNGGDASGSATVVYDATGLKDGTVTHASYAGHSLEGYYAEAEHTTKVLNNDGSFAATNVTGYITGGKWTRDEATTLYAFWAANPQTVTFDLDGKGDNFTRIVDNGTPVTRPADPTNIDYNFDDWYTDDGAGNATNTKYNFSTNVTADITIHAKWTAKSYEHLIFACVDFALATEDSDPILVTSRNGYNIMATKKLSLTVTGALNGHRVTLTGTDLKFYKNDGTRFVELTGSNSLVAPLTNQVVYVSYNPTSAGTGGFVTPSITVACDGDSQEFPGLVKARNLPEAVAIVAKVGSTWQALPANIGSESTPAPIMVTTATEAGILKAYGPATVQYKLWPALTVNSDNDRFGTATASAPAVLHGDYLRFAGNENKGLWANNSTSNNGIKNYAAITTVNSPLDNDPAYEWKVTTTEVDGEFVYTLQTDQTNNTNNLRLWGSKWGTYESYGQAEVYILPLEATEIADITIMEWGTNMLAVKYANASTVADGTFKAQIGTGSKTDVTCARLGDAGSDIYKLTGVGDLQSNPGKTLVLTMTETSTPKQAVFAIPLIVTAAKTEAEISSYAAGGNGSSLMTEGRAIAKGLDVIIRKGGTLSTGTASGKFANLYIYPGGKVDISQNIGFANIYLRGGFSWLDGTSKTYDLPQMKVADEVTIDGVQSTGNGVYYDLCLDKRRYYMIAVPKDVPLASITNEEGGDSFTAWLKQYSGQGRTLNPKQSGWVSSITGNTLYRGVGYEMSIKPRVTGRLIGVLRMPLLQATAWTNEGECTPSVKAWGYNDDNVTANNKGWNFIGNPYFTAFRNTAVDGSVMEVRDLVKHLDDGGNWNGKWDWTTSEDVKYVTIPQKMYDDYYDVRALNYELESFYPFFIQAKLDGMLTFTGTPVIKALPSLYRQKAAEREVIVDFKLTDNTGMSDQAGLTVSNEYSADFDMEDKEKTIVNTNYLKVYTLVDEYRTAFNSLPEAVAALPIPVGYIAPQTGTYEFSLVEGNYFEVKHVWLTDYETSSTVDLLDGIYEFQTNNGQFDSRFAINVILKDKTDDTPTGGIDIDDDSVYPQKFIYHDNVYILVNGVIFDATGKKVKGGLQ